MEGIYKENAKLTKNDTVQFARKPPSVDIPNAKKPVSQ